MEVIFMASIISAGIPTTGHCVALRFGHPIYVMPLSSRALYFARAYSHQHLHLAAFALQCSL